METNSQVQNTDDVTSKVNVVLQAYLAVVDSVAREPSMRINTGIRRLVNNIRLNRVQSYLLYLKEGELFPLSFIVIRYVENLFLSYHIKARTQIISDYLQYEELRTVLSSPEEKERIRTIKSINRSLTQLESILSRGVRLQILLVISPVIPIASAAIDFLGGKLNLTTLKSLRLPFPMWSLVIIGVITLFYLLFVITSSFIAKRQKMVDRNIYKLEQQLFETMHRDRPYEKPLDLIGWTLIVVLYFFFWVGLIQGFASLRYLATFKYFAFLGICLSFYILAFVYLFIRRFKLKRW